MTNLKVKLRCSFLCRARGRRWRRTGDSRFIENLLSPFMRRCAALAFLGVLFNAQAGFSKRFTHYLSL